MATEFRFHPFAEHCSELAVPTRCKIVHLIRHAQGQHNAAVAATGSEAEYCNWAWFDSRLTALGEEQAAALRPVMEKYTVDVVVVSPLSRAIRTAQLAIPPGPLFVVEDLVRERIGTHPCDKRRPRSELKRDFPDIDLSGLQTEEDDKWTEAREPWSEVVRRANEMLHLLRARPETHIAVVTHNDFLTALLHDASVSLMDAGLRIKFRNAEHLPVVLTWEDGQLQPTLTDSLSSSGGAAAFAM